MHSVTNSSLQNAQIRQALHRTLKCQGSDLGDGTPEAVLRGDPSHPIGCDPGVYS